MRYYVNVNRIPVFAAIGVMALLIVLHPVPGRAVDGGTTPAAYLRQGTSARAMGMGHAFVGLSDDASAIFWNPAGIGLRDRVELSTSHTGLTEGRSHDVVSFVYPANKFSLSAGYVFFGMEGIPHTQLDTSTIVGYRSGVPIYDVITLGYFEDKQHAVVFGGSYTLNPAFRLGSALKLLRQRILDHGSKGYAFDFGGLYNYTEDLTLGLSFRNCFGSLEWDTASKKEEDLKVISTLGASYRAFDNLVANCDLLSEGKNRFNFRIGAEWKPLGDMLALRAGFDVDQVSLGAGISMGWWHVDYAFVEGKLGDMHRISANLMFDKSYFKPSAKVPRSTPLPPAIPPQKREPAPKPPARPADEPTAVKVEPVVTAPEPSPVSRPVPSPAGPELIARKGDFLIGNIPVPRLFLKKSIQGESLVEASFMLQKVGLLTTRDERTGMITIALGPAPGPVTSTAGVADILQMEAGSVNALVNRSEWMLLETWPEVHKGVLFLPLKGVCKVFGLALTQAQADVYR